MFYNGLDGKDAIFVIVLLREFCDQKSNEIKVVRTIGRFVNKHIMLLLTYSAAIVFLQLFYFNVALVTAVY